MRKSSKVLSLIIVLSMLISSVTTVFADVSDIENHWAKEEISYMLGKSYLSGYPDGTFKPEANISKAEFYRIINNLMGYEEKGTFGFKDVKSPDEDWFYYDVAKGIKAGYIVDAEYLYPKDFITREEVARIIGVAFKLNENAKAAACFNDYALISSNAVGFIGTLKEKGYIAGFPDGSFGPTNNITRAEVVKMLYNILIAEGIPQKVDLIAYKKALAAVKQSDYTKESWTKYQKVVLANVVTEESSQKEVDAATQVIIAAQKQLVKVASGGSGGSGYIPSNPTVDKASLVAKIAEAQGVDEADYTKESWDAFQTALASAQVVNGNTQATQGQVDAAVTVLTEAIEALELKPVDSVITNLQPSDDVILYTGETLEISFNAPTGGEAYCRMEILPKEQKSINNYESLMVESEKELGFYSAVWTVPENTVVSELIVRVRYTPIEGEMLEVIAEGIVKIIPGQRPSVDKTALAAKIAEAQALNEGDYTPDSWATLQVALTAAIAVNANVDATQVQVDEALVTLTEAITALVPVAEPQISATFHPQMMIPTFGKIFVEVGNIEGAAKFNVTYHLAPKDGKEVIASTKIIDIGTPIATTGYPNIFYNPATTGFNTVVINVFDAAENLIYTFEGVVPVRAQ